VREDARKHETRFWQPIFPRAFVAVTIDEIAKQISPPSRSEQKTV